MSSNHVEMLGGKRQWAAQLSVYAFVAIPFAALLLAIPAAWGWGLSWLDIGLTIGFYVVPMLGVTVGFHRYFTHGAFKAPRVMRIVLAVAGSMAVQGPVRHWVADHRRHHAHTDKAGDPHSPWLFGTSPIALVRGFCHAHFGWILSSELSNQERFCPDLVADKDIRVVHRLFGPLTIASLLIPTVVGWAVTGSWQGGVSAFFWAGLVRVTLVHHVSWSVNSICHMIGSRPFTVRDKSTNFWPLAVLSLGESWHNLHHADPTCARHGVQRGQIDISARVIWAMEKFGWVYDVKWPAPQRLARLRRAAES